MPRKPKTEAKVEQPKENLQDLLLNTTLDSITNKFGKGAIILAGVNDTMDVPRIPFDHPDLDELTGGGIPRGRVSEVMGWAGSGKSTLCLEICAAAQKMGLRVAYIDTENALDPGYANLIGLDLDSMPISQPSCAEEALEIFEMLVKSGAFGVVVLDSVAAMATKAELEGEMTDQQMGDKARLLGKAMRKTLKAINSTQTAAVFVNQYRKSMGYGGGNTTPGGHAIEFAASLRLEIARKETLYRTTGGDKVPYGQISVVKAVKNKVALPFAKTEVELTFPNGSNPAGLNRIASYVNRALDSGKLTQSGSWFSIGTDRIAQGKPNLIKVLSEKPELLETIK